MAGKLLWMLLLVTQTTVAQSLRDRIEAEAMESVADILSATIETTLISEGREPAYAACVGRFVEASFKEATDAERKSGMPAWIDKGKRQCDPALAAADDPLPAPQDE